MFAVFNSSKEKSIIKVLLKPTSLSKKTKKKLKKK